MDNNLLVQNVQGQPRWFCLNDVCSILGLGNPCKVVQRLDPKGLTSIQVLTNGFPSVILQEVFSNYYGGGILQ